MMQRGSTRGSLSVLEYKEPPKKPPIVYKYRGSMKVWWFNPRTAAREVWTIQSLEEESGGPLYVIVCGRESRRVFEGAVEEWIDEEAEAERKLKWDRLYCTVWDAIDPVLEQKAKEVKAGFKEGTTKAGDYYRHWARYTSNTASKALFEEDVWRVHWKVKQTHCWESHKRGLPSREACFSAIGELDSRFGDGEPFFAPVPVPGPKDFVNVAAKEAVGESFDSWKAKNSRIPSGNHRRNLYIAALEEPPERLVTKITAYLKAYFFNLYVMELEVPPLHRLDVRHRQHEGTGCRQLHMGDLFAALKPHVPGDAFTVVVLTMDDLYSDSMWDFSLGQDFPSHHMTILSLARYDPAFWRGVDAANDALVVKLYDDPNIDKMEGKSPIILDDYLAKWRALDRVLRIKKRWAIPKKHRPVHNDKRRPGLALCGGKQLVSKKCWTKKKPMLGVGWEDRSRKADDWVLILRRACKMLSHELDHLCGIGHCLYFNCRMNGSIHLRELDLSPMQLCPVCLHKHMAATGIHSSFRCTERYVGLKDWFRINKPHYDTEAAWTIAIEKAIELSIEKAHKESLGTRVTSRRGKVK